MDTVYKMLDELSKYGMTEIQAKVYYYLLKLGRTSPMKIAKEIGVHRSEVYRVQRELKEKGIVFEHRGRPIVFSPMPPEDALKVLHEEQMKRVKYLEEKMPKLIDWLSSQSKVKKVRPSVLLIDDDENIQQSLSDALKSDGLDVDVAGDGSEALKKASLRHYNIALVDIRLPDIEGTKLLKRLKEETPDINEIIITGYPSIQNAVEAVNEGADAYILKPFDTPKLLAIIKEKLKK